MYTEVVVTRHNRSCEIDDEILQLPATWMELEGIAFRGAREKDKYQMISLICGIDRKKV